MKKEIDNTHILQKAFNIELNESSSKEAPTSKDFLEMLKWQVEAFDELNDKSLMILNAPTGSGKSFLMCALSAYKLKNNATLKCIIGIPQTIIAPGFANEKIQLPDGEKITWATRHNLCDREVNQGIVNYIIKWLENPLEKLEDRILLCTHATLVKLYRKLKSIGRQELLSNLLLWIDEAHHVSVGEDGFSNGIGELVEFLSNNADLSSQVGLTTATYFRGDKKTILVDRLKTKFKKYDLPYDKCIKEMKNLKSFSYDFLLCGPNYIEAIKSIIKRSKQKDIIYIPHPVSNYSMGNKRVEAKGIVSAYQEVHGGELQEMANGLTILKNLEQEFKILDLVTEDRRSEQKEFISSGLMKKNSSLDSIIALGMFQEGANWIHANRCLIVGNRSSLVTILQMLGRILRDAEGKEHVEVIHLLPFSLDQKDPNFRDNLNDFIKAVFASLILEDILSPVTIQSPINKIRKEQDRVEKEFSSRIYDLIPDESVWQSLVEASASCMLNNENCGYENHKEQMLPILGEYAIEDTDKNVIVDKLWRMHMRRSLTLDGIDVKNIDFNIVQDTHPLDWMLRYTTNACGIDTLQKLRAAIQLSRNWRPFELARQFVKGLKLKSETEWRKYIVGGIDGLPPLPSDIPRAPCVAYEKKGWISWGDFLGTDIVAPRFRKYRSYEEACQFAQVLELKKKEDWFLYVKGSFPHLPPLPEDIPACPDKTYRREEFGKKWQGWGHFLGTQRISNQHKSKTYRTYSEAQKFASSLGLSSSGDWRKYINGKYPHLPTLPMDIPKKPDLVYENFEWYKFLGCNVSKFSHKRNFWSFEKSRKWVHRLGLKSYEEWVLYCAGKMPKLPPKPMEIPSNPQKKYKNNGWQGYADWIGLDFV